MYASDVITHAIGEAGLGLEVRPQQLSLENYVKLYHELSKVALRVGHTNAGL